MEPHVDSVFFRTRDLWNCAWSGNQKFKYKVEAYMSTKPHSKMHALTKSLIACALSDNKLKPCNTFLLENFLVPNEFQIKIRYLSGDGNRSYLLSMIREPLQGTLRGSEKWYIIHLRNRSTRRLRARWVSKTQPTDPQSSTGVEYMEMYMVADALTKPLSHVEWQWNATVLSTSSTDGMRNWG